MCVRGHVRVFRVLTCKKNRARASLGVKCMRAPQCLAFHTLRKVSTEWASMATNKGDEAKATGGRRLNGGDEAMATRGRRPNETKANKKSVDGDLAKVTKFSQPNKRSFDGHQTKVVNM